MQEKFEFKILARAINQLGEQLIKSESIALLELLKNAYDADATTCRIALENPELPDRGEIRIIDNGTGMDFHTLTNAFLEIGTDFKEKLKQDDKTKRTPKFGRLRLGEKGIGRLGIHKLGRQIQIISRCAGFKTESVLEIDWDMIERSRYVENIPVFAEERKPEQFKGSETGTLIIITKLRNEWSRRTLRDCKRMILSLNSPFESDDSFRANFSVTPPTDEQGKHWFEDLLEFGDIEQYKLFSFDITLEGTEITKFYYEFCPWKTMKGVEGRVKSKLDENLTTITKVKDKTKHQDINLSKHQIGTVRFCGSIFDRESKILDLGVSDKMGLKQYLNENGGIRVFRNNVRVLNYGEPGDDWLKLDSRRVNTPGVKVSNNLLLASVFLNSEQSTDLIEKANREGFLENEAYNDFVSAILFALERVEQCRTADKKKLRERYSPKRMDEPVINSIAKLRNIVEKHVKEPNTKKAITRYVTRIQDDYEKITDTLIRSAGAGLNLMVVIHQIEKIVKNITARLKQSGGDDFVLKQVNELASLVEGYSILVKQSDKKLQDISTDVKQGISNVRFRFKAHKIELIAGKGLEGRHLATYSSNHILNALMNLFDNSIWWLCNQRNKEKTKKIFVDVFDNDGYVNIAVADNGPGFNEMSYEEAVKPFTTLKPGGMGIGLHLTDRIMESMGGRLCFSSDIHDIDIPKEYTKGAIVVLTLKKEK